MNTRDEQKTSSIMRKFAYGILIPLVMILVFTGILLNNRITKEIDELQGDTLQTETEAAVRLIEGYFDSYFSMIETTAALPAVQEALLEVSENGEAFANSPYYEEIREALDKIQKLSPEAIQSLYIADFTTSQYLRWDGKTPEEGWDITTRPYYSLVTEEGKTILTSVFQNVAGITVVSLSTPVYHPETGQIMGSVNIDLGLESLIESMNAITIGENGYIVLLDSESNIIAARESDILLKNVENVGFSEELVKRITGGIGGNTEFSYQEVLYCGNVRFVDMLDGWCVLGVLPATEYHLPIQRITAVVIVCFVICAIILLGLCVVVVQKITHPIKRLSTIVGELANGNLNVGCPVYDNDEIGYLADGVRILVESLQTNMQNVREAQEKLEHLAYTDVLTDMGNRLAFQNKLQEYDSLEQLGCVVADVNHLKICNDKYGHIEGDQMIADAAACIRAVFAELGSCYRIGGDEFCVLLPDCKKKDILDALEKAKKWIAEKNESRTFPMSIAFGYALREGKKEGTEELFNRGDEQMYDTKKRMKSEFSVYREEAIFNYLKVLNVLKRSTDNYFFLWDIPRNAFWFLDDIDDEYAVHTPGSPTITVEEMARFVYPADYTLFAEELSQIADGRKEENNFNCRWFNKKGEIVWINCRGQVIVDNVGNPFCMIGRISDQLLKYLYHPLTKLFNKEKMLLDLEAGVQRGGYLLAVSIDNLTTINTEHSRSYGDQIIKSCAAIMEQSGLLQNIWHTEGNCFALYLAATTEAEVEQIYEKLLQELSEVCTISAGAVSDSEEMFELVYDLYACATLTLEKAKKIGEKTLLFFSKKDMEARKKTIQLFDELHESVENGCQGFYLNYQPLVRSGNYQIYGAEALLRYHSETLGEIYPDEFIPLLEQSKLINEVGLWVLETALRQCGHWRSWLPKFHINVNFSVVQLSDKDVADNVLQILDRTGMPGEALTIELTENIQLHGIQYLNDIFRVWRDAGIELSIDDFGTGYASMSYLQELNVAEIKIDRLFVRQIAEATYNYRLISSMIDFAKNNSIRIICEGVEDIHELLVLEQLAPNLIQGYLFSKPCTKEVFEATFVNEDSEQYQGYTNHVQEIYQHKSRNNVVHFDAKDILRETDMGLWMIRISQDGQYCELNADETMEKVLGVDKKYTPEGCYQFWFSRIQPAYVEYVKKNVEYMIGADNVVQLQYPWLHPKFGEVMVRCSGKRVEDSDGMITLEGCHRIISDIEEMQ